MWLSNVRLYTIKETHSASLYSRIESRRCGLPGTSQQHLSTNVRFPMGRSVRPPFHRTISALTISRSVAFMDLGFLIIANSIMRTRLPPKQKKADNSEPTASMRTVLKDIPFLVYTLGSFFVSRSHSLSVITLNEKHILQIFWGVFVPCLCHLILLFVNLQLTSRSVFYLQLYSSLHGVDAKFTKYCVCILLFLNTSGKVHTFVRSLS